jgi:hypothetical protein
MKIPLQIVRAWREKHLLENSLNQAIDHTSHYAQEAAQRTHNSLCSRLQTKDGGANIHNGVALRTKAKP